MNDLQVFNFGERKVRTLVIDDAPWWVLVDVCRVLDLGNARMVALRLDSDEVRKFDLRSQSGDSWLVNESGLYKTILRSDKPAAKAFTRWVMYEVLPAIRNTSRYIISADDDANILREMKELDELNARVEEKKKALCRRLVDGTELSYGLSKALFDYLQMQVGARPNVPLAFPPQGGVM